MKRVICMLVPIFMSWSLMAAKAPEKSPSSSQLKQVLANVSGSIVKVVSEAGKVYVGTGIALERDLVLTSTLLTRNPDARLSVIRMDERRFPARLKGQDEQTAVAMLELDTPVLTPIATADNVEVGDWIALVGAFYDQFPAVQQGVVSSVSRDAVILNAAAVPGSSGGAVLNADGRLVAVLRGRFGFATAPDIRVEDESGGWTFLGRKYRSGDLSFAVPISRVSDVAAKLRRFGHVPRGWAGVHLTMNGEDRAVRVAGVQSGSPAARAGLRTKDRILTVNGSDVSTVADVARAIRGLSPGDTVRMDVQRQHLRKGIIITLEEGPKIKTEVEASTIFTDAEPPLESAGTLPMFRRFLFHSGKDAPFIFEDFRRRMRDMAVSAHHSSLEPVRRELRRLIWEIGLIEHEMERATPEHLQRLRQKMAELEAQTHKALELRERQLHEDRKSMKADFAKTRRRLDALKKKRNSEDKS